jgi:serine protease Do
MVRNAAMCLKISLLALLLARTESVRANPQVYERCLSSVALVLSPRDKGDFELGTAILVNERERILLTNYHVVEMQEKVIVFFPAYKGNDLITNYKWYKKYEEKQAIVGKVIARAKDRDLALIKLPSLPDGLHEMPMAARSPKPGETLHAVGNSGYANGTLWRYSKGEVRQVCVMKFKSGDPTSGDPPFEVNARIVETQIPVNRGDSGGPVMNQRGELTAVTQSVQNDARLVSFMIDISEVRAFLKKEKLMPAPKKADRTSSDAP